MPIKNIEIQLLKMEKDFEIFSLSLDNSKMPAKLLIKMSCFGSTMSDLGGLAIRRI